MARVKRGVLKRKRRKKIIKQAKGYKWGRKSKFVAAKDALKHAWVYAYRDRKKKKGNFRRLWQIKINAICRENGVSYSRFIEALTKRNIIIDRKILAELAQYHSDIFKEILKETKR